MRLIDADALKDKIDLSPKYADVITAWIDNTPTICDIDKILDEIKYYRDSYDLDNYHDEADALTLALKIIDMHTAGSRITNNE